MPQAGLVLEGFAVGSEALICWTGNQMLTL